MTTPAPRAAVDSLALERPRWRLTVHRRNYGTTALASATGVAELSDARSRRLETSLNAPATFTCSVPGDSPGAAALLELRTDLMAWRWDDAAGAWVLQFRGVVAQSQDTISENGTHTVNITAHDHLSILNRRYLTNPNGTVYTQTDQDNIAADLLARALAGTTSSGASMVPGSVLQLAIKRVNPDGSARALLSNAIGPAPLRDRTYEGNKSIGEALTELGAVINGYDLDVQSAADSAGTDYLRIFYPSRGISRPDLILNYGGSVQSVSRSVNPATSSSGAGYANYWRAVGTQTAQGAAQMFAEAWNADASNGVPDAQGRAPVGLWQATDSGGTDVSVQSTLNDRAAGDLAIGGVLVPSYTLGVAPGWWSPGAPALGDTVPLVIQHGRLSVNSAVRILSLNIEMTDDGAENVAMTVGRPARDVTALLRTARRDIDALARR